MKRLAKPLRTFGRERSTKGEERKATARAKAKAADPKVHFEKASWCVFVMRLVVAKNLFFPLANASCC